MITFSTGMVVTVTYLVVAVLWFLRMHYAKNNYNYELVVCWTLFFPVTLTIFGICVVYFIGEDLIKWMKKEF